MNHPFDQFQFVTIVVLGASGDLAKKKTYPALFQLFRYGFLRPSLFTVLGYARSKMTPSDFHTHISQHLKIQTTEDTLTLDHFLKHCIYVSGQYDNQKDYSNLRELIQHHLEPKTLRSSSLGVLRLFYLALPPSLFVDAARGLQLAFSPARSTSLSQQESRTNRLIVEKPFGRDLDSSNDLTRTLKQLFKEEEIYRIDHYLGKEMVKNVLILRFANTTFRTLWNRESIANVQITFKETFGIEGRGGYFDQYGIIRDVMQNHLLQILALVAMESPKSLTAEDIRDEKVKALKCVRPIDLLSKEPLVVVGQYESSPAGVGYLEDPSVTDKQSRTPTYAAVVLQLDNPRWKDVPFILKCGKALDAPKAEVRIQFKPQEDRLFNPLDISQNELVIRVSPKESVYLKLMVKKPGLEMETIVSELDLCYQKRFGKELRIPDAYESLLLDVLRGDHSNFVRDDELSIAWSIFTPLLHHLERSEKTTESLNSIPLEKYPYGSRGPKGVDRLIQYLGYQRGEKLYTWKPKL